MPSEFRFSQKPILHTVGVFIVGDLETQEITDCQNFLPADEPAKLCSLFPTVRKSKRYAHLFGSCQSLQMILLGSGLWGLAPGG